MMIKTSKQLGLWIAICAAIAAASQAIPSSVPAWVAEYVRWIGTALSAGLALYTAYNPGVTLPAERELGERLVTRE